MNRHIPALALTDRNNLFALVKFYENSLSKGVKPILGSELWITPQDTGAAARIVALAKDLQGYKNLLALISNSYTESNHRVRSPKNSCFGALTG